MVEPSILTKKYHVKRYGEAWFNKRAITNILAFKNAKSKFNYGVFTVHKTNVKDVHFNIHQDVLHYHNTNNRHVTIFQTVSDNEAGYAKHQLNIDKLARDLYAKVGNPYQKYFNKLIKSNLIGNFPVTLEASIRSKKMYGPNITTFTGKTTQINPYPVVTDYITPPPQNIINSNKNITIRVDILCFNQIPFFATISRNINSAPIKCISNSNLNQFTRSISNVNSIYINRVFSIKTVLMDR